MPRRRRVRLARRLIVLPIVLTLFASACNWIPAPVANGGGESTAQAEATEAAAPAPPAPSSGARSKAADDGVAAPAPTVDAAPGTPAPSESSSSEPNSYSNPGPPQPSSATPAPPQPSSGTPEPPRPSSSTSSSAPTPGPSISSPASSTPTPIPVLPPPVTSDPAPSASEPISTLDQPGNSTGGEGLADAPAWSNPNTWPNGRVPQPGTQVRIPANMKVRVDQDVRVGGLIVDGDVYFDPDRAVRVDSTANVVVNGRLVMIPDNPAVKHELRFVGVNESRFRGGGMQVLDSDVGLWVVGSGQLVTEGAAKRGWTNARGGIGAGARTVAVDDARGWRVGDEIVISPTANPGSGSNGARRALTYDGFHEATITAVQGNSVTFSPATSRAHPQVNGKWTAEVMNLSRNVVIRGEDNSHKSHIFIRSNKPQFVKFAELLHLAPGRLSSDGIDASGQKLGRYALHFHHAGDGTQGSIVEGVSLHQFGNHGFVPHESYGITFFDTVAYDGANSPYWWDQGDDSHDILWDRTIGARTGGIDGVYFLGNGQNIAVRNSVAVGGIHKFNNGGFKWDNHGGSWDFHNNLSHNIYGDGVHIWQNTNDDHILHGLDVYHVTGEGVSLGAYTNNYHFKDFEIFGANGIGFGISVTPRSKEKSDAEPPSVVLERGVIDGANVSRKSSLSFRHSAVPGRYPIQVRDVQITGRGAQTDPAVKMESRANAKKADLVNVNIGPGSSPSYWFESNTANGEGDGESWIRVQNGSEAFRLRPRDQSRETGASLVSGWNAYKKTIAPFRPDDAGTGTGLLAEYYDDVNFSRKVYTGIDPYVYVHEEDEPIYYRLRASRTGARWTGLIEAPESGTFTFRVGGEQARLWIDGTKIIDNWSGGAGKTGTVQFQAGRKYTIRLEVAGSRQPFHADLIWKLPSYPVEQWVPQSQLYLPREVSGRPNDPLLAPMPSFN